MGLAAPYPNALGYTGMRRKKCRHGLFPVAKPDLLVATQFADDLHAVAPR